MSTAPELHSHTRAVLGLKPGEMIRVKSAGEIFATLDERGMFDGLPFMPEMLKYCGRRLPVAQRCDTTCAGTGEARRMYDTVHLQQVRCDGSAHSGCQAACLMFWKEAWLERAEESPSTNGAHGPHPLSEQEEAFVAGTLMPAIRKPAPVAGAEDLWSCQATEIPRATEKLRFREVDQYVRDLQNWKLPKIVRGVVIEVINAWQSFSRRHLPERLQIAAGNSYPFVVGKLDKGKTPKGTLDLQPGDLVRIKSKREIVATLDKSNRNRGLTFDNEMANYCGRTARVHARVTRIIEERTGEMVDISSDCIILEGVVCASDYHRFCTRAIFPYWREIWLEKIEGAGSPVTAPCANRWSRV